MKNRLKKYPFQDTISYHLPGEVWKDIEGYECSYQISSFGRVKSLERQITHQRLGKQWIPLKILNQKVLQHKNTISKTKLVDLQVALTIEGNTNFFNVRRLVYHHYIKPINYKIDGLSIVNIDGDGFNCHLENLEALSQRDKRLRSMKKGRVPPSYLGKADRSKWEDKIWGGKANRKPVRRIDKDGKAVIYESISKAVEKNNIDEKGIIGTCKKRYKQWKGYQWEYVNPE